MSRIRLRLHYLDAAGKELKDFPWSQQAAAGLVGAKAVATQEMGAFLPDDTASVTADVLEVHFQDGSDWKKL